MIVLAFWLLSAGLIVGAWTALLGRRAQVSHFGLGATILCFAGLCLLLGLPFTALAEIVLVGGGVGGLFFTAERWLGKGVLARGDISWFLLLGPLLLGLGTALVSLRFVFNPLAPHSQVTAAAVIFAQPQIRLAPPLSVARRTSAEPAWITPALWLPLQLVGLAAALTAGAGWSVWRAAARAELPPTELKS